MDLSLFTTPFNKLAPQYHRYQVFNDFVVMSAIAIHNSIHTLRRESLEVEHDAIRAKYSDDEYDGFRHLFSVMVQLLNPEPKDVLGELYMTMGLGNTQQAQYFTPHSVNKLTAMLARYDPSKSFHRINEPSCGSGGLILAYVNELLKDDRGPLDCMIVVAQDIDRTAAMMCYIQLSLWNVPARIVVGDTLLNNVREEFYTPAFWIAGNDQEFVDNHFDDLALTFNGNQYALFE